MRAALVLIGFSAVIAQIVLMRELIVVFYGNEVSLGLMLAVWLLWTAFGSGVLGRLFTTARGSRRVVAGLEALVAAAFPLTIFAVRASRRLFQAVPGEMLGPVPMFLTALVALSLFCALSGWLFAAGSRLYATETGASTAGATGSVYLLEAIGSGAGGLLAGMVLIRYLNAFDIAALVGSLNLLAAAALALPARYYALAGGALVIFPFATHRLEAISLAQLWHGFHLVETRNSVYGNLAVTGTEDNLTVYENGLAVFHVPDPGAAEESVHYALLEHPAPRSVLLIGGGVNGSLAQALQHPTIERLDYVELDPAILELARRHFPLRADPRVHIHNMDGRLFVKTTARTFDVIIVNLPDPQTAQLNRFYTLEFFREAARRLTPSGVFSFGLSASENYISPELAELLRCINKTLREALPEVAVIPGDTLHFFAATRPGVLVSDAAGLLARLRARHIKTTYVREYYIPFRMMPDRMRELESEIRPRPHTPVNRDFAPIAYYLDAALWNARFHSGSGEWFRWLPWAGLMLLVVAMAVLRRLRATAGLCAAAMGFTMIGLEILLLMAFQAMHGYVYQQLAIVIAAFMAGMALGSWRAARRPAGNELRLVAALQLLAAGSGILLYWSLGVITPPIFPVLALAAGLLGGYQFPLVSRLYFVGAKGAGPGALYALDLAGSCAGAVLFSAYLVPVTGFLKTALVIMLVNAAPALLVIPDLRKPAR